jgi:hypothetical protein
MRSVKIRELNDPAFRTTMTGERKVDFVISGDRHLQKSGANVRSLVGPTIRWRVREWLLRVDLTR